MNLKRFFTTVLALVSVGFVLTGCAAKTQSNTESANSNKEITIGLTYIPNIQFAPVYVAAAQGFFQEEGLNVTIRHHGAQESLFGALESGEEDIVFAGGDEMLQARSNGTDVVYWATMYQQYPVVLIVPETSEIKTWEDLKGKKVGIPGPYGENYFGLLAALEEYNLKDSVQIEYIGYTQNAALVDEKVDAVIGFANNDPIGLAESGIAVRTIPLTADGEIPLVGVGFGSKEAAIDSESYAAFLRAIEKALQFANDNPAETLDITTQEVPSLADPVARATAEKVLTETLKLYQGNAEFGSVDTQQWSDMAEFMLQTKLLEKEVSVDKAFTTEVINAFKES